jgi:hypothetical protein
VRTSRWTEHFFYRTECTRTTWKFRIGLLTFLTVAFWLTSPWWTVGIARSLACEPSLAPSDAILVENFESSYRVYERAAQLRREGFADRVLVHTLTEPGTEPDELSLDRLQLMATRAQVGTIDILPTRQREPIVLNAVRDMQRFLERERIRSLIVVMPLFRSRRSALVYEAILSRSGILVRCEPLHGSVGVNNWTRSWHGIQDVVEQWLKLQYYRLYVLPFASN